MKTTRWQLQCFRAAVCVIALFMAAPALAQMPCRFQVSKVLIGPINCFGAPTPLGGLAISPNGEFVCGYYALCNNPRTRGFVYKRLTNQFIAMPFPSGVISSYASDVSDSGLVVGEYERTSPVFGRYGFIYNLNTGQYTELAPLSVNGWCRVNAINGSGTVCGYRSIGSRGDPVNPYQAFTWSPQQGFQDLGLVNGSSTSAQDINDDGWVAGSMINTVPQTPFLWKGSEFIDLGTLAGLNTVPQGLNNRLEVVGSALIAPLPNPMNNAFRWSGGTMTGLGFLPSDQSGNALSVSDDGVVLGFSRGAGYSDTAVWWDDGGIHVLADIVQPNSLGLSVEESIEMSRGHVLLAYGLDSQNNPGAIIRGIVNCCV